MLANEPEEHPVKHARILMASLMMVLCAVLVPGALADEEAKPQWKPLMNGKTLEGWHSVGEGTWTVEEGAFVGRADKTRLYGLLVSDDAFKDFTVRLKFKCLSGDSGFYIRTIIKEPEKAHGLQVQVGLAGSGVGGIYESYGRAWIDGKPDLEREKKYTKTDAWNEMTISAHGGNVVIDVNGTKTAELKDDKSRPEGHFALQMHAGCVMHVMFKEIEICEE